MLNKHFSSFSYSCKKQKFEDLIARPYQSNIIEVCKKQNSIVFLPTGAGKSFIAFSVIKHFSHQLEKSYDDGGKRSFFLVNTQGKNKSVEIYTSTDILFINSSSKATI